MSERAFTALLVNELGMVLFAQHLRRLSRAGEKARDQFLAFAREAAPGVYLIRADSNGIQVESRGPSWLADGILTRTLPTPYPDQALSFAKPVPPHRYEGIRTPGIATLLTSLDGNELYESCTAALLSWSNDRLIAVPRDRPIVRSVVIDALEEAGLIQFAPISANNDDPIALVNAVAGIKLPAIPGRASFPLELRHEIAALIRDSARRG